VVDEKNEWVDVVPFPLKRYAHLASKPFKSFSEALDEYFSKAVTTEKVSETEKEFSRELKKLQRTLENQQQTIEESKPTIDKNKSVGNLIYSHLSELQQLAQKILEEKLWENHGNK